MKNLTAASLAAHFIRIIIEWADPADLARLRAGEVVPGDILDDNEALAEAWHATTGEDLVFDPADAAMLALLNEAHNLAKAAGYHPTDTASLLDTLANVTAALDTVLLHQGQHMTPDDLYQRRMLVAATKHTLQTHGITL